jgi:hypothetical protein
MEIRIDRNLVITFVGLIFLVAVFGAAYYGFSYYKARLSAQAHAIFMERYTQYEKLSTHNKTADKDLIDAVAKGYTDYKNSSYGPFFLALQAEIYQAQGNKQEALQAMTQAVNGMSSRDAVLYYTYWTKLALMQLDAPEPAIQTKGRQALEKLALMGKNPVRDMASFYLGYQALLENDNPGVQGAWGRLFDGQRNPLSIWGVRAQSLLNYTA